MERKKFSLPSNKKFGLFFSLIFFLACIYFLYFNLLFYLSIALLFLSIIFLLLALFFQEKLSKLNILWFKLGVFLGKIISPIVCGIIYFLVIIPFGIFYKIFSYNSKKKTDSYYKKIKNEKYDFNYFKRQY